METTYIYRNAAAVTVCVNIGERAAGNQHDACTIGL